MIIYTTDKRLRKELRRKKKSKSLIEAERRHAQFLKSVGYTGKKTKPASPTTTENTPLPIYKHPTSDLIPTGVVCSKKSIDDWKWKKGLEEAPETIAEIERKKKRVAVAYNKGAYQYRSDGDDPKAHGKK